MAQNLVAKPAANQKPLGEALCLMSLRFQYLTPLTETGNDFCLMKGTMIPGGLVPVHSHKDHEIFYILSGELQGFNGESWQAFGAGDVFDAPGETKHALRNTSSRHVEFLSVTTMNLGWFLYRLACLTSAHPGPSHAEEFQRISEASAEAGYWIANPEENASAGIDMTTIS